MNAQTLMTDSPATSLSDLAVLLAACTDGPSASAMLADLHGATCGAVLCNLEPQALANVLGLLGESGCADLFAELADVPDGLDMLLTLATTIDGLKAPHVAPVEAGGKLSPVSKVTIEKAKAAAVGRAYKSTGDIESPDLNALAASALAAELSDYGIEQAEKRGVDDVAFARLLKSARSHGATCGASVHKKDAVKWAQVLGDKMFLAVAVLLDLELCEFGKDGEPTAPDFPRCADAAPMLVEYMGLANIAITAAQTKALETMPDDATAKQRSAACKGARNVIVTRIDRQLQKYGVKVNLQTGDYSERDLDGGATKSEKAAKAVVGAFGKSTEGALSGLVALDDAAWSAMVAFVTGEQSKRDQMAREAQNASLSAMSIANAIKARATDDATRAAAKKESGNS